VRCVRQPEPVPGGPLPPYRLREIVRRLRAGQIIAYPTEAVFGLGCDPCNATAVRRLLAIKRRPVSKGLILIAATLAQLEPFLEPLAAVFRARLEATWPGPLTWLVPARQAPGWLRGTHATLAVRVTAHPLAAALCRTWGGPLVSTSANRSGRPPARSALAVRRRLGNRVDYIVPGAVGGARQPTEIHDLRSGQIVRAG
jgi:L-threonylcarbamoyladenylate synthase